MKKLRILLLFSCFLIFIKSMYIIKNNIYDTNYHKKTSEIVGIIISYHQTNNTLILTVKAKEKVQVYYYLKENEKISMSLGDQYYITGKFIKMSPNTNFNLFHYQRYMRSKKIYWQCQASGIKKISSNSNIFYFIKNKIKRNIEKRKTSSYMKLFLMGDKTTLEKDILKSYQANGISHLFAISGMHITLFTLILNKILSFFISNKKICFFLLMCFLGFYLFLADFQPSLVRSVLMFIVLTFSFPFSSLEFLFYLFFGFLLFNAYYLYNAGFLFSFLITFALISCGKIINRFKRYYSKLLVTSLISFLVSIPLVLENYFILNFLSPFLNCFFVPLVSVIIFPVTLFTYFLPFLDEILIFFTNFLETVSLFFQKINCFSFAFTKPSIVIILLYYGMITFILYQCYRKKYHFIFLIFVLLIPHYLYPYINSDPRITIIDVGQGDSTLIELPHKQGNILIDTGGKTVFNDKTYSFPIATNIIIPYLYSIGIEKLDYLILTHGDQDHAGEAEYLIENFAIKKVFLNSGKNNFLEKKLIKLMHKKGIRFNNINRKQMKIGNYVFSFLNTCNRENENEDSLILYTNLNNHNILLMGDAGEKSEEYLIHHYKIPKIDILKLGHHGSKYSSSAVFLKKVKAKYALISCGKNNRFGHPSKEALTRLKKEHILYYRTDETGMIRISLKKKIKIETVFKSLP